MILVDSSVWIDFLNGTNSTHRGILHGLIEDEEDVCITEIIFTEVLQGIRNEKDFAKIKNYLLELPIYSPKGIETYLSAVKIYRAYRGKGKTVRRAIDCIIAAIAMENDIILLHKDSDFDSIAACMPLKVFKTD